MGMMCLVFALLLSGLAWHTARLRDLNDQLRTSNRRAVELKDRAEQSEEFIHLHLLDMEMVQVIA